jgi:hypothetical protein
VSERIIENFISPNFSYEKLESPSFDDLVDVFEDRMRNWLLLPASKLLNIQHCQIASVSLLCNYFEGIEIYLTGKDSKNKSSEFFANAFFKVFNISTENDELRKKVANSVYLHVRCGFAHDSMFRNRVLFSEVHPKAISITLPKKNGIFDTSGKVESIVINPIHFYQSIQIHFDNYVKELREGSNLVLRSSFEAAVKLKWALDEQDIVIGMTEDEFYNL